MTASVKKILIIAPAWIGDMVMAQSLYKRLRQRNYQIDVAAPASTFALLSHMPEVSQCWQLPFVSGRLGFIQRFNYGRRLRQQQYDQVIVLPNSWKSALTPFFAAIPRRTGWLGESRYGLLNDYRHLNKKSLPLMVQRFLALANERSAQQHLPAAKHIVSVMADADLLPQLQVSAQTVDELVQTFSLSLTKPIISLCPGAAFGPSKCWPADYFAAVAKAKVAEGYQVYLLGAKGDMAIAERIQQSSHHACVNLVGKTSLAQAIAALSISRAAVSNDSGLMHIACALPLPVVALFGSSSSEFTPPLSQQARVLDLDLDCRPCFQRQCPLKHHRCLRDILPEQVMAALENVL